MEIEVTRRARRTHEGQDRLPAARLNLRVPLYGFWASGVDL